MYADHVPQLRAHGEATPQGLADLITFALLTIRQPFTRMPEQFREVRKHGAEAACLFGWKQPGYEYAHEHSASMQARLRETTGAEEAIEVINDVPGLGIVKSAFVAQMLGHDVACFDSRNAVKLKLGPRPFRPRKDDRSLAWRRRQIVSYVHMTRESGGAEFWWNDWCERVGRDNGMPAIKISAIHLEVLQ